MNFRAKQARPIQCCCCSGYTVPSPQDGWSDIDIGLMADWYFSKLFLPIQICICPGKETEDFQGLLSRPALFIASLLSGIWASEGEITDISGKFFY